jgi:hypothetical protein
MRKFVLLCLAIILCTACAFAGPPFLTDDPVPVSFHHYEFYAFSTLDQSGGAYQANPPGFEFNAGPVPNLQLHIGMQTGLFVPSAGATTYGLGDTELGAKYRFIQEKGQRPQISFYPLIELPTGDSRRNLGNGTTWAKLPLWLQKSWGSWTSYGGAGYIINHAPGERDHIYAGWQAQREINKKLALGGEWFTPGRDTRTTHAPQIINAGGIYNFSENFSLLFSGGHSVHGNSHTVAYIGLYWTWGPKDAAEQPKVPAGMASQLWTRPHP